MPSPIKHIGKVNDLEELATLMDGIGKIIDGRYMLTGVTMENPGYVSLTLHDLYEDAAPKLTGIVREFIDGKR